MIEFLLSFGVFACVVGLLALGVLLGRGPLRGSCGGNAVVKTCPLCRTREER